MIANLYLLVYLRLYVWAAEKKVAKIERKLDEYSEEIERLKRKEYKGRV